MRHSIWLMALAVAGVAAVASPVSAQNSKKQESRDSSSTKSQGSQSQSSQSKSNTASTAPASAATAAVGGTQPSLLGQYGDWGAYTAAPGGRKVCFARPKPTKAAPEPSNRPRDPAYMFISHRPAEKVANEVSVIVGYGMKPNQDAV